MIKEIKYGGITTTPSDYESKDGDLASSSGIVLDEGRILVTRTPTDAKPFRGDMTHEPLFIHNTTDGQKVYIMYGDSKLWYRLPDPDVTDPDHPSTDQEIGNALTARPKEIDAIGNTLICLYEDGTIRYIVYRDGSYTDKGSKIPTVEIGFGLKGKLKRKMTDNLEMGDVFTGAEEGTLTIDTGYEEYVTNRVFGEIELALREYGDEDDKFSAPFLVRYALRLYDGSYTNISAPVLMDNNYGKTPVVSFWANGEATKLKSFAVYNVYSSLYAFLNSAQKVLNGWEDVVKSIDIFVSRQFRNYDTTEKVGSTLLYYGNYVTDPRMDASPLAAAFSVNAWDYDSTPPSPTGYAKSSYLDEYVNYFSDGTSSGVQTRPRYQFDLPYYSEEEMVGMQRGKIALSSTFYKLYSFKLSTIGSGENAYYGNEHLTNMDVISVEHNVIANIETQQPLHDDYYSNDTLKANTMFAYNSRLSFGGIGRYQFRGFAPYTLNAPLHPTSGVESARIKYTVLIEENGIKSRVETSSEYDVVEVQTGRYYGILPSYFFYPNPYANTLVIDVLSIDGVSSDVRKKIDLVPHPTLNGAYYISRDVLDTRTTDSVDTSSYPLNTTISYPFQIYTSEAYNPYVFKAENINQLPIAANILNIASTTQPMSQGQFGQYPLYVFSDMGIFALQLASNGSFSSLTPVTRDIILGDGSSLTQLDDSLLFATKQGIMELVGKNTRCISTELDVEGSALALADIGKITDPTNQNPEPPIVTDFKTFISGCKMVYDYVNARIVVFNPALDYAYIYSAKDKAWSIIDRYDLIDTINAYPEAQAVASTTTTTNNVETTTYSILDLSTITDEQTAQAGQPTPTNEGWFITRPISLDADNNFKFVDTIRQNGVFEEYMVKESGEYKGYNAVASRNNPKIGDPVYAETGAHEVVRQVLYGSNDLINWFVCGSSRSRYITELKGAQFKWYRLAVRTKFKYGESLSSVTFSYRIKTDNPHLF